MLVKLLKWVNREKADEKGFTLIELLIVIVIIGILSAVAVPTYTRYMSSAKAAAGFNGISAIVQYAEGIKAATGNYPLTDVIDEGELAGTPANFTFTYTGTASQADVLAEGRAGLTGSDTIAYDIDASTWSLAGALEGISIPTQ